MLVEKADKMLPRDSSMRGKEPLHRVTLQWSAGDRLMWNLDFKFQRKPVRPQDIQNEA